jgi:hypothetical protein
MTDTNYIHMIRVCIALFFVELQQDAVKHKRTEKEATFLLSQVCRTRRRKRLKL